MHSRCVVSLHSQTADVLWNVCPSVGLGGLLPKRGFLVGLLPYWPNIYKRG
jgi:hypothetical protein